MNTFIHGLRVRLQFWDKFTLGLWLHMGEVDASEQLKLYLYI